MKVYAVEYDFYLYTLKSGGEPVSVEHKLESFTDLRTFFDRVKYLSENTTSILSCGNEYIKDIKVYSGILSEISLNTVLNPF